MQKFWSIFWLIFGFSILSVKSTYRPKNFLEIFFPIFCMGVYTYMALQWERERERERVCFGNRERVSEREIMRGRWFGRLLTWSPTSRPPPHPCPHSQKNFSNWFNSKKLNIFHECMSTVERTQGCNVVGRNSSPKSSTRRGFESLHTSGCKIVFIKQRMKNSLICDLFERDCGGSRW